MATQVQYCCDEALYRKVCNGSIVWFLSYLPIANQFRWRWICFNQCTRSFTIFKLFPKCYDAQMLFHKLKTPSTSSSLRHTPKKVSHVQCSCMHNFGLSLCVVEIMFCPKDLRIMQISTAFEESYMLRNCICNFLYALNHHMLSYVRNCLFPWNLDWVIPEFGSTHLLQPAVNKWFKN